MCDAYLGVAQIGEGDWEAGVELLDSGIAGMGALGTKLTVSQFEFCAADGLMRAGQPELAAARLEGIMQDAYDREERLIWSEYLRVRGEAEHALGRHDDGLASLRESVEHAKSCSAIPLIARSEQSLADMQAENVT